MVETKKIPKHQYIPFNRCSKCDGNVNQNWIDKETGVCIYCKMAGPHEDSNN